MRIQLFPEHSTAFTSQETLYQYLYGGQAIVTLESPSGVKHTYSYEAPINRNNFPDDVRFVYAIHHEDDEYIKFYLGMIEADNFRMTRNSRFSYNSPVMKGAFYIEQMRKSQEFLTRSPMTIYHNGTCGMCRSKLTASKSLMRGFGRTCYKKFQLPGFFTF